MSEFMKRQQKAFSRKVRKVTDGITYGLVSALGVAVRAMNRDQARRFAWKLGDLMHHTLGLRRNLVYRNLELTFPEKSASEIREIATKVYRNVAVTLLEVLRLPCIKNREDAAALVDIPGAEEFSRKLRERKKGAVVVSAHYGNWELMATAFGLQVVPVAIIVKRLRNKAVDLKMNALRTLCGNRIIYKRKALREGLKVLESGGVLAVLSDQSDPDAVNYGDFLGRRASMFLGAAFFALKADVPLIVGMCQRSEDGRYRIEIHEIDTSDLRFCKEDIVTLAARYTRVIETYIRQWPEEWFWLHDRWKRS